MQRPWGGKKHGTFKGSVKARVGAGERAKGREM